MSMYYTISSSRDMEIDTGVERGWTRTGAHIWAQTWDTDMDGMSMGKDIDMVTVPDTDMGTDKNMDMDMGMYWKSQRF